MDKNEYIHSLINDLSACISHQDFKDAKEDITGENIMKGMYRYRGFSIEKIPPVDQKWTVSARYDSILNWSEYNTLDEAKNAIDELLGGQATDKAPLPERWKKSEKLKKYWED